jgi:hypothetical protein
MWNDLASHYNLIKLRQNNPHRLRFGISAQRWFAAPGRFDSIANGRTPQRNSR